MRISDWSSDVCSSELVRRPAAVMPRGRGPARASAGAREPRTGEKRDLPLLDPGDPGAGLVLVDEAAHPARPALGQLPAVEHLEAVVEGVDEGQPGGDAEAGGVVVVQPLAFPHQAADPAGVGPDQHMEVARAAGPGAPVPPPPQPRT